LRGIADGEAGTTGFRAVFGAVTFSRLFRSASAQVAEYFLRRETGEMRIDAFRPVKAGGSTVEFASTQDGVQHRIEFSVRYNAFGQRLMCEAEEESGVSRYELVSCTRMS
jgi:hypothetical protein